MTRERSVNKVAAPTATYVSVIVGGGWRTLSSSLAMRLPWPAARMTTDRAISGIEPGGNSRGLTAALGEPFRRATGSVE